ncbi:MAG: hypothetical protein V4560_17845 [Bacteroidota bacterium]
MKKEKGIDDIFKHGLEDPVDETVFREDDWDALENMLDKNDKRAGRVYWLPILGSVAAILLAVFGWWLFKPQATTVQKNKEQLAVTKTVKQPNTVTPQAQQQMATTHQPEKVNGNNVTPNAATHDKITTQPNNTAPNYTANINRIRVPVIKSTQAVKDANNTGHKRDMIANQNIADSMKADNVLAAAGTPTINIQPTDANMPAIAAINDLPKTVNNRPLDPTIKPAVKINGTSSFRPQYALTVLASSEVNGVGSFNSTSSGTNIGLMFTAGVKKFSISTGANYSTKPYTLPFDQYHTAYKFKNEPQSVTADCRVLDIPINIGYQVYNKSRNKITLGTGISSYIMMHESYTYDYGDNGTVYGPSYYAVKGKGKYYFSIMNIQATYERKINSKVGLSLQPYFKLPLSDIGYSQVKVQTFGVAVGLNWNINSLTKPK